MSLRQKFWTMTMKLNMYLTLITLLILPSCASNKHEVINSTEAFYSTSPDRTIASEGPFNCFRIFRNFFSPVKNEEHSVPMSKAAFKAHYDALNETLSGNLATVFRSEWKAKENYNLGSKYLTEILSTFGGSDLSKQYSHLGGKEYIEKVVDHLREIKKLGKISMRDPPAPKGSFDRTFTYYTKALADGTGAKHQVRLRTYLRQIVPEDMVSEVAIQGLYKGNYIEVKKLGPNEFKFITASSFSSQTKEYSSDMIEKTVSLSELKSEINEHLTFYAYPHGNGFKLEVKTRPHDEVHNPQFEKLLGKNYVQKLSVDIRSEDISLLFKDNSKNGLEDMRSKLALLKQKASINSKNSEDRINAIFNLLTDANELDPDFLVAQGSTEYKRYAFELELPDLIDNEKVRIQTTFDYDMGVRENYNKQGKFLDPFESMQNPLTRPFSEEEDLHIELKVPKMLVERSLTEPVSSELTTTMKIFNSHQVSNTGKFNHINEQRDLLE